MPFLIDKIAKRFFRQKLLTEKAVPIVLKLDASFHLKSKMSIDT